MAKLTSKDAKDLKDLAELSSKISSSLGDAMKQLAKGSNQQSEEYSKMDKIVRNLYDEIQRLGEGTFKASVYTEKLDELEKNLTKTLEEKEEAAKKLNSTLLKLKLTETQRSDKLRKAAKADYKASKAELKELKADIAELKASGHKIPKSLILRKDELTNRLKGQTEETYAENILNRDPELNDISAAILKNTNELSLIEESISNIKEGDSKEVIETIKDATQQISNLDDTFKKMGITYSQIKTGFSKPLDKLRTIFEKAPGGRTISKAFGLEGKINDFGDKMATKYANSGFIQKLLKSRIGLGTSMALSGVGAGIGYLLKVAMDYEKESVELAHTLDISKQQAFALGDSFDKLADDMGVAGIRMKQISQFVSEFQQINTVNLGSLRLTNDYADSLVQSGVLLVQRMRLTTEEVSALNMAAIATGTSIDNLTLLSKTLGDNFVNGRDILREIAKVSKTVLANFKGNPAALAEAVKKAKLLGLTLDQINNARAGLLNIETSIEDVMTANILTGENMNINMLMHYQLIGDTDAALEETKNILMSIEDFDSKLLFQREAIAKVVKLDLDIVSEMVNRQKFLKKLGYTELELATALTKTGNERRLELEKIVKLKGEEAALLLKQKYIEEDRNTIQEKFDSQVDKLNDKLKNIALPILTLSESLLSLGETLLSPFEFSIFELQGLLLGLEKAVAETALFIDEVTFDEQGQAKWEEKLKGIDERIVQYRNQYFKNLLKHVEFEKTSEQNAKTTAKISVQPKTIDNNTEDKQGLRTFLRDSYMDLRTFLRAHFVDSFGESNVQSTQQDGISKDDGKKLISLLEQLNNNVSQPTKIIIGNKVVDEIGKQNSLARNYNVKTDAGYNTMV